MSATASFIDACLKNMEKARMNPSQSLLANCCVLIVAAGRGTRFGGDRPKQYCLLAGKPVLTHTIEAFARALPEAQIVVAIHADDSVLYHEAVAKLSEQARTHLADPVLGGATRQNSVYNGLEYCFKFSKKYVLIQDAARPFITITLIHDALNAAKDFGAAIPGTSLIDTIKQVDNNNVICATPDRSCLRAAQTPQAFRYDLILAAHRQARDQDLTDDAAVAEHAGHRVHIFPGDPANMKITASSDLASAERRFFDALPDIRMGQGFDVHAFEEGDGVWLGGVLIPHHQKLKGHSDADVLLHAITDAILGALADGDIGAHFPPSDPQWKGATSALFLEDAVRRVQVRGGTIAHVDATLIAERPKIGPHRDAIRIRLAEIMKLSLDRVAVKATTSERLGFTGREEGIAALAIVTIRLPLSE